MALKHKIFVDGREGTTGLMINERLAARSEVKDDIEVLAIDPEKRKDTAARAELLNEADIVFLCLPDAAAVEAVGLIKNKKTRVIDASTAHRTAVGWAYGLPELSGKHRDAIKNSPRVTVPGCFATGFATLVFPLVSEGLLPPEHPVYCHSVTGYSGGGKKLIGLYEDENKNEALLSPCLYSLGLDHKHLPEMRMISGLKHAPLFSPIVADFYKGMTVAVPLHAAIYGLNLTVNGLREFYSDYYRGQYFIEVMPEIKNAGLFNGTYLPATGCNGTNRMELYVSGGNGRIMLIARLDNLWKGSSGAALQCMNIMTGADERLGLINA